MTPEQLQKRVRAAVAFYWATRSSQNNKQRGSGRTDQGSRSAVTGGAQMDALVEIFADVVTEAGVPRECVFRKKRLELPGFYRPTKEWDLLVVRDHQLVAVIEAKSQVGPSFGNNFNSRTEEAMGSALDIWTDFREGAFLQSTPPFLGYLFMLEDCEASQRPVKVSQPHFRVFPEFVNASYRRRYEIFCRKLVLERQHTAAAFIASDRNEGSQGHFRTPAADLSVERLARALAAHVATAG